MQPVGPACGASVRVGRSGSVMGGRIRRVFVGELDRAVRRGRHGLGGHFGGPLSHGLVVGQEPLDRSGPMV